MTQHKDAPLAQLVEHLTLNQGVQGSIPWWRTRSTIFEDIEPWGWCFFIAKILARIDWAEGL